jgi:hypothetical protein
VARTKHTYAIRLAVEGGGQVKAELVSVGQSGEQSLKRIESAGERASAGLPVKPLWLEIRMPSSAERVMTFVPLTGRAIGDVVRKPHLVEAGHRVSPPRVFAFRECGRDSSRHKNAIVGETTLNLQLRALAEAEH